MQIKIIDFLYELLRVLYEIVGGKYLGTSWYTVNSELPWAVFYGGKTVK